MGRVLNRVCGVEDCDLKHHAKGLCKNHYVSTFGRPKSRIKPKVCSLEGCEDKHDSRGFCRKHYRQKVASGEIVTAPYYSGDVVGIDHNHTTGVVRGLLCHNCNAAIGHLSDSISLLEKAATYLKGYQ